MIAIVVSLLTGVQISFAVAPTWKLSALRDAVGVLEPPAASEEFLGQPVGTALAMVEMKTTETPRYTGRF